MPRVAEIDRAILAQLRKNGRMSYVDLAREVSASSEPFEHTFAKWKKRGQSVAIPFEKEALD